MQRYLCVRLLAVGLLTTTFATAGDLTAPLDTIKSVGAEAAGNAAAREAWRKLAASDAAALPEVLTALDDANPLAANYLRAAVDAIAERTLREKQPLPNAELERFTLDTEHSPRARRLAFEWLTRVDRTAPDRLIPQMLHDPSVEFRRDAVARLLDEAESLEADKRGDDAAAVYRRALSGARDLDQVQQIVKKLDEVGEKVDVAQHFGYLVAWKLAGPYDNEDEKGFDIVYPPERAIAAATDSPGETPAIEWRDHSTNDQYGKVDLNAQLGKANSVLGYAVAEFAADEARPVELRLTSLNANKVWLNGKLLSANNIYHSGSRMDQYIARGELVKGRNVILLKICQNNMKEDWAQEWNFQLRVCDATGTAVLSADRGTAPPPAQEAGAR